MKQPRTRGGRVAAIALILPLAACARFGGTPPAASPTPDDLIAHPSGDALVLRIENEGGFVAVDYLLSRLPAFTLTGDGRVIVPGAQADIYPGSALPSLLVRRLSEEGIQALLREALASGQLDADHEWRGAQMHVADAADTVFTLHAGDREVRVLVYALGILDDGMTEVSADERDAHGALLHLADRLADLASWLPSDAWLDSDWQPYRADALRLLVRNADGEGPDPNGVARQELPWPGGDDPATFGAASVGDLRCGVVVADEAAGWYTALEGANQLTRWTHDGHRYQVTARPLLPDEPAECPAPA